MKFAAVVELSHTVRVVVDVEPTSAPAQVAMKTALDLVPGSEVVSARIVEIVQVEG